MKVAGKLSQSETAHLKMLYPRGCLHEHVTEASTRKDTRSACAEVNRSWTDWIWFGEHPDGIFHKIFAFFFLLPGLPDLGYGVQGGHEHICVDSRVIEGCGTAPATKPAGAQDPLYSAHSSEILCEARADFDGVARGIFHGLALLKVEKKQ